MSNERQSTSDGGKVTTTDAGIPASSDEFSLTVGADGPILLQDHYLIQKMAQFNRERVPERVVHAKGGGAHGYFEVTADVTPFTKAKFLERVGKRTPVFIRFSTVAGELGSPDTTRDPRGFAIKFYTEDGNYDLVGNNTPIFFVRDPLKFQDFIHSQKRHPVTDRRDNNMQWDFWTLSPESAHQVAFLFTDRGTPRSWRTMNGYGSHTFLWVNAGGERFWVKYHFKTDQGIESFTGAEAKAMAAEDPDYHIARPVRGDREPQVPILDARDADHAVRRRGRLPLQPVRPHQGLAPWRLSAPQGRPPRARPQPGELLRRGRAGGVRAGQHGAGHRSEPGQDAAGPAVQLSGHSPLPHRHQLPAAADQPAEGGGAQLQQGRRDAVPPQR